MEKFFDWLQKYIMGPMLKISQIKFVRAITQGGMATISFTIVGSMLLVVSIIPDVFTGLEGVWAASFDRIEALYLIANNASLNIISIYFLVVTTYEYARIWNEEEGVDIKPITAVCMSIFGLWMVMPEFEIVDGVFTLVDDAENSVLNGYASGSGGLADLASTGIFSAFIMSWLSVSIYRLCVQKNIIIKMPEQVPEGVSRSFSALIPAAFLALVCMVIDGVLTALGTNLYDLLSIPFGFVVNLTDSLPGILVILFLIHALWLVGIHGATIVTSPLSAISLSNLAENAAGTATHVFAGEYLNAFCYMGGSGATLGLCLEMIFLAKSDQLKYIGRSAIVPGLFNINEPILFGMPIVFNPNMAIPFFLAPMAGGLISYLAISWGLCNPVTIEMAWPTPIGLGAWISCAGDWRAVVVCLIDFVVEALIYFPFFKAYDNQLYKEEQEKLAAEQAAA